MKKLFLVTLIFGSLGLLSCNNSNTNNKHDGVDSLHHHDMDTVSDTLGNQRGSSSVQDSVVNPITP